MSFAIDLPDFDDALAELERRVRDDHAHDGWSFDEFWATKFAGCSVLAVPKTPKVYATVLGSEDRLVAGTSSKDVWVCVRLGDPLQFAQEQGHEVVSVPIPAVEHSRAMSQVVWAGIAQSHRPASFDRSRQVIVQVPVVRWVPLVPTDQIRTIGWFFAGWVR